MEIQTIQNKNSMWLSMMLSMFMFVAVSSNIHAQVIVNENGSFESSEVTVGEDTTTVDGWTFEVQDGDANFTIVEGDAQEGDRALAVEIVEAGADSWSIQAINEPFSVIPGETHEYSVWLKASSSNTPVNITAGNPSFAEYSGGRLSATVGTEWEEFNLSFTVPSDDTTIGRAPLHFSMADNAGDTIYVDNLSISAPNYFPIIVEAESGEIEAEWDTVETDEGLTYITTTSDYNETSGAGDHPGTDRTVSYEVTFPDTGSYDLFARVRVGSGGANDDSFFFGNGFGEKDPETPEDWFVVNSIDVAGFAEVDDVVRSAGGIGSGTWKWVNLSRNKYSSDTTLVWEVQDALTHTFEIGARENGLEFDKFAFGPAELFFTVRNLDSLEAGSVEDPAGPIDEPTGPIAAGEDKWLGNIYSPSQTDGFTNYWNQVTPENAGKWGSVESTRDNFNWSSLDAAYALAKDNELPFRFHVLIWGSQQPEWIEELPEEEQLEEIEEWFEAVATKYPDIDYLEVVNEPLHAPPTADNSGGYIEALGGSGETGWDWVIKSFELAREYFPDTDLMINDYNVLGSDTDRYMQIVDLLIERDLIDVIGAQGHHFTMNSINPNDLQRRLDTFAERGLPIQVTEYDIAGNPNGDYNTVDEDYPQSESDETQLEAFKRTFPIIWEHEAVQGVTLWGWRLGGWRPGMEMNLVHSNGQERPALEWLRNYVDTGIVSNEEIAGNQPKGFQLHNNYPNPFNPTTKISYDIGKAADVNIKIYDVTGRLIQTLVNNHQTPGSYTVNFDASNLSTGVYFYRIQADNFVDVKQMMLIK